MNKSKLPLANSTWDKQEYNAIQRVISSDRFTMGPEVKRCEQDFASYLGTKYCVMVNSGSSANLLAIAALIYSKKYSLKSGDEVIVPAVSWSTTYYPLLQYGLKLKFVDIDKNTLNYDLDNLKEAVSENTKLIVVVNLLGNPNNFSAIDDAINGRDIIVFEDNCESLGATYNDRKAGTFGVLGTYSTFFSHHISTMEGGFVSCDDTELYHVMLSLRTHGWTRDLPEDNLVHKKNMENEFYESFNFVLPGYNLRPLEMSGAIGIEQIKKLDSIIENRRKNAQFFQGAMEKVPLFTIQQEIGNSSWFGFAIILNENDHLDRNQILQRIKEEGIEYRPIVAGNFVNNPVIKYFDYTIHGELPNAQHIHKNGFFIGNHHYDVTDELQTVVDLLMSYSK